MIFKSTISKTEFPPVAILRKCPQHLHQFLFSHKSHQMRSVYFLANEVVPYDFFRYLGWICDNNDTRATRSTRFITIRSGRVRISATTTARTCAFRSWCACYAVTASTTTARSSWNIWFACTITTAATAATCSCYRGASY